MTTVPAPSNVLSEEWNDADFDLPDGLPIHTKFKDEEEEDWDMDLGFGKTGGAKLSIGPSTRSEGKGDTFIIRPPQPLDDLDDLDDDDDDEGVSTIKVAALTFRQKKPFEAPIDEDFEDAFALPSDLTQLSLAPLSLHHQSSKGSLEWGGDKDQTSSSQSSDAYSTLGLADASPSSNSTSSASVDSETEDDCDEDGDLDGLVIPQELFESSHGSKQLAKILAMKKATLPNTHTKTASIDPEEDFEMGLVIDDDVDLSPSRLLYNAQAQKTRASSRSNSMPAQRSSLRPPSRLKSDRAKSPVNTSSRNFQKLRLSPSPPNVPTRSQTFQALSSAPLAPPSFLSPKPGSLRGQKSHTGLKPPSPTTRKIIRKASLSSLLEASHSQASGSSTGAGSSKARYEETTAASRAKSHKTSLTRIQGQEFQVPPTRPSTPSSNPVALRLTMPTQSRLRSRPPLSSVWNSGAPLQSPTVSSRTSSPIPTRPPSSLARPPSRSALNSSYIPIPARQLKRPKKQRTYGDGTELDGIDDLPTDRDKESHFHVLPKMHGNRIPGGSYSKSPDKGTIRRRAKRDASNNGSLDSQGSHTLALSGQSKRSSTSKYGTPSPTKRKKGSSPSSQPRKKPMLIRNLGGASGPKVVGDMRWNPHNLRWEGNENALKEFDAVVTSTRPALITHLTGSSLGSPVGSFASGARRVGNMIFDPSRMCWISTLSPEEDEPDVFANLADDEEEEESKGGTIRASIHIRSTTTSTTSNQSQESVNLPTSSPARSLVSDPGSDRGSRGSSVYTIDDKFVQGCRDAEARHWIEMKGWRSVIARQDVFAEPDRSHLYDIRALATRKY